MTRVSDDMTDSIFEPLSKEELSQVAPNINRSRGLYVMFTNGHLWAYDRDGFLTSILTPETLWQMLEFEAQAPGTCREFLRSRRSHITEPNRFDVTADPERESRERAQLIAEAAPIIKRYTERGKLKVDIPDDLVLDLDLD